MSVDIVLIDDNIQHLETTKQLLHKNGLQAQSLPEPQKALNFLQSSPPRLIILDIMMPGMDGFTLLRDIKADDALRDIPVIILSGKGFPPDKRKAISLGAEKYLTKPIQSQKLLAEIQTFLR